MHRHSDTPVAVRQDPRHICLYVPGILTWPGDAKNWSGRAVTWTHIRTESRAEKVEYFCGPLGRAFGQQNRAVKLYRTLDQYRDDWHITLVGHSNGAAVILKALSMYCCPPIDELHLVCAACEASFHKNRLNFMLTKEAVKRVSVYVAEKDLALRLAHSWLGRLLGYGILGLHGPRHVLPSVEHRVSTIEWSQFGHSTCWQDYELNETLSNFVPAGLRHSSPH